jgi:PAS domain-containing protein
VQRADSVIAKFGGQTALARLIGKGQSTVQHWAKTGNIPAKWQAELLRIARGEGIELGASSFAATGEFSHVVQFYENDAFLVEKTAQFIGSALELGNSGIIIATKEHRDAVARALHRRGFDIDAAQKRGNYHALDAAKTLSQFMVEGRPNKQRFAAAIESLIVRANAAAKCENPCAAAFGEMVALLWAEGKQNEAIELEQLWNDLAQRVAFSLLCGYPMESFSRQTHRRDFASICAHHLEVIPAESYSALTKEGERRRTVARLQQKLQALETEIRLSEERAVILQAAAGLGIWELDLIDDSISLSAKAQQMLGAEQRSLDLPELLSMMPDAADRDGFKAALHKARTGRKRFAAQFRIARKNRIALLSSEGKTLYNSGQPLVVGVLKDGGLDGELRGREFQHAVQHVQAKSGQELR